MAKKLGDLTSETGSWLECMEISASAAQRSIGDLVLVMQDGASALLYLVGIKVFNFD